MRVQVLQHVEFERLGSIEGWLAERGATVRTARFFQGDPAPATDAVDLVIALGGPMSVNDEMAHPWLAAEKGYLRAVIGQGAAVLGICLGAQLIANALGSRVYPAGVKEIGWFPVEAVPSPPEAFRFPERATVFHWHGETFDLPPGAGHLARSTACAHQAFQVGRKVMGLQFHLETTPESAELMIRNCGDELVPDRFVQTADALRAAPAESYDVINRLMAEVLGYVTGFVVSFLVAEMGGAGLALAIAGHLPQNLLQVPALVVAGTAAVAFSMQVVRSWRERRRVPNFYPALARFTGTLLAAGLVLVLAALVESYLTPALVRLASGWLHLS
jgi:GMP synthase-like glutamine amidotransferase